MAKATDKTTSTGEYETPTSKYVSGLEHELCELSNHAYVASKWLEDILGHGDASEMLKLPDFYHVNKRHVEGTLFLVYDLERRINRVRDEYFAAIEAGAISQSPGWSVSPAA